MKTYEDYTEKERADFTTEQVESLLKYELMKRGVLMPPQPVLETVPDEVVLKKQTFYAIRIKDTQIPALFETQEKAAEAVKLICGISDTEYPGSYRSSVTVIDRGDARIVAEQAAERAEYEFLRTALKTRSEIIERNEKTLEEFRRATTEVNKAVDWVWNDWREQCLRKNNAQKLQKTFLEYLEMCDQNKELASRFLDKISTRDAIDDARLFVDFDYLTPAPSQEEVKCAL